MKIGVISDNHGYIHPGVFAQFSGVDQILHAGDIGGRDIITSLETIAPVQAVYGNIDTFPIVSDYPEILRAEFEGVTICMTHIFDGLSDPRIQQEMQHSPNQKLDIMIFGHSHQARLEKEGDTYLMNPGAAGKRRFSLRISVGLITISGDGRFIPEIIYLD